VDAKILHITVHLFIYNIPKSIYRSLSNAYRNNQRISIWFYVTDGLSQSYVAKTPSLHPHNNANKIKLWCILCSSRGHRKTDSQVAIILSILKFTTTKIWYLLLFPSNLYQYRAYEKFIITCMHAWSTVSSKSNIKSVALGTNIKWPEKRHFTTLKGTRGWTCVLITQAFSIFSNGSFFHLILCFYLHKFGINFKEYTTYAPLDNSARTILKKKWELG
jgi:hypothetical protein